MLAPMENLKKKLRNPDGKSAIPEYMILFGLIAGSITAGLNAIPF